MILRGMGDDDGATSTGPAWVPTYGPAPSKSTPSAGPSAPMSPMKLIVATALVAGGIVGLASTVNWRKVLR